MSVEKSVYQAPTGLFNLGDNDGDENAIVVTVEGEDPEVEEETKPDPKFDDNLAEHMDDGQLAALAGDLLKDYEDDLGSRKEWVDTYVNGLKLLGLKYEEMTEPWSGACGVFHPLLMEAAVKFQAETITETFPAAGPVRTRIIGKETQDKKDAAARVQEDMNYELTERMPEYRPEHERALLGCSLAGNAFKKIYFDPALGRQTAPFITADDIIVNYGATNLESAERITHRMRKTKNELKRMQWNGFYRDIDLGEPVQIIDEVQKKSTPETGVKAIVDHRFQLLEMHVNLDLEGYEDRHEGEVTGIAIPYVVTIEKGTKNVLAIRRNWIEGDELKQRRQHFVHYGYIPGFGFYHYGLIHLIGGHARAATSIMRQLIDAGTLSNLPGGLKARGLRMKGDDTPIAPGEWRDVDLPSGAIKDNILPLPYKEPSLVLMQLMDKVVADAQRFAATADLNVSDMSAQTPVGTTLAILERVLKVMSAVQARIHFTMKQEFKLLALIIRDHTPEDYDYEPEVGDAGAKQSDYDMCDVLPVSDPNASTMAQRIIQYQAVLQLAGTAPAIYNMPMLHRQMIEVMGVKNAAQIVPLNTDMKPVDPVSENMFIMNGKPVKAFMYQDHQSHLAVHISAMQDPKLQQIISQNPKAQEIMGAGAAHVMEHLAFEYRAQLQQKLGASLPVPPNVDLDEGYLDPEVETQVSQVAAVAAQQLLLGNQQEMKAQQVQQQQQDPIIQLQQQEMQIKQGELELKKQVAQQEMQIAQAKNQTDQLKAQADVQKAQMEAQIAGLEAQNKQMAMQLQQLEQQRKNQKDATDAAAKKDELDLKTKDQEHRHEMEGAKLGVEIKKHQAEQELGGAKLGVEVAKHKADKDESKQERGADLLKTAADQEHQASESEAARQHQSQEGEAGREHQAELAKQTAKDKKESKPKPKSGDKK